MSLLTEERPSESPYIETITHGWTVSEGSTIRPSEVHWHLVFTRHSGRFLPIFVGPLTAAGMVTWGEGAEIIWIKFKLGVYFRPLPPRDFLDKEIVLPEAGLQSFWLNGSAWQFPDIENVDTFIHRLVREDVLVRDPIVYDVLQGHLPDISSRTLRHRFLRATGLAYNRIYQVERAQRAAELLREGKSIADVVFDLGYYDQPHLTRAMKQWFGFTPAQIPAINPPQ